MDIKILVAYHKPSVILSSDMYLPIHVGRTNSQNVIRGIIGDDTGDNISYKNSIYCEMTAIYWAWKNIKADYIGLCHYRRIFTYRPLCGSWRYLKRYLVYLKSKVVNFYMPGNNLMLMPIFQVGDSVEYERIASEFEKETLNSLNKSRIDAIVPCPVRFSTICVRQFFDIGLEPRLLMDDIVRDIAPEFFPYYEAAQKSNFLFAANMFVMKRELFDDYCSTIFPLLEEHEKRTINSGWCNDLLKERCYSRRSGYFAEFLTSAYIFKMIREKKKLKYANVAFLDLK